MTQYSLWHGDTRLGVLTQYEKDWPWTFCRFEADPPFAGIQPLFEESYQLLKKRREQGGDWEEWHTFYEEKIATLNLFLRDEGGRKGKPWRLHIHDGTARFRLCVPYWQKEA